MGHLFCVLKMEVCASRKQKVRSRCIEKEIGGAGNRVNNCRMGMKMESRVQCETCGKGEKYCMFLLNCREETEDNRWSVVLSLVSTLATNTTGNLREIQITGLHSSSVEPKMCRVDPHNQCFSKASRWFWCMPRYSDTKTRQRCHRERETTGQYPWWT